MNNILGIPYKVDSGVPEGCLLLIPPDVKVAIETIEQHLLDFCVVVKWACSMPLFYPRVGFRAAPYLWQAAYHKLLEVDATYLAAVDIIDQAARENRIGAVKGVV